MSCSLPEIFAIDFGRLRTSIGRPRNPPGEPGQFLRCGRGRKPQICRRNFSDICHTVGDISTSGLDGHIAISGYPSMSPFICGHFLGVWRGR